jgi:hypothetical protein
MHQLTNNQNTIILVSLENMLYTEKRPEVIIEIKKLINHYTNLIK